MGATKMNDGIDSQDPTIEYYDGDYLYKNNHLTHNISNDISRYQELASKIQKDILEICCGTGRVAIPLANKGYSVTGVDISQGMLRIFQNKLEKETIKVKQNITLIEQDATKLDLNKKDYELAIIAFNSLLCIPNFEDQCQVLKRIHLHLVQNGLLIIDLINPLQRRLHGEPTPKPLYTRENPNNGKKFTRFSAVDAMDENHRQRIHGWYDEYQTDDTIKRTPYSIYWRFIFRFEIELMLKQAGFEIIQIEGGYKQEPYTIKSPCMFIQAKKI